MYKSLCLGIVLAASGLAHAQGSAAANDYPNKPITVIYPAAAGGAGDPLVRRIMEQVGKVLGQPIVVDNKPGGNFTIGPKAVLAAPADGYTLLVTFPGHINMKAFMDLPYDPIKSFEPIAKLTASHYWFVVRPDLPARTFGEFVGYAKAHQVNHGTLAVGSTGHVFAERVNATLATRILSAVYRGEGPIVTDVIGGHLDACFCSPSTVLQHVKAGRLRVLATTAPGRSTSAPEVPSFAELGYTGSPYNYSTWLGVFAPEKTPPERVKKVAAALETVMQQPAIVALLKGFTIDVDYKDPAEFQAFLEKSMGDWLSDVKQAKIKIE